MSMLLLGGPSAPYIDRLFQTNPHRFVPKLQADANYYVRVDGNDDNDGSANDAAHAWRTVSRAVTHVLNNIHLNGYSVTIHLGDGTYAASPANVTSCGWDRSSKPAACRLPGSPAPPPARRRPDRTIHEE